MTFRPLWSLWQVMNLSQNLQRHLFRKSLRKKRFVWRISGRCLRQRAVMAAGRRCVNLSSSTEAANCPTSIRQNTERGDEAYADSCFVNDNSQTPPQIVDQNGNPIMNRSEICSGVYARVSINFYAFNSNGSKGVACGLGNIQKVRDGQPLGNRSTAEDDFAAIEDAEDDFLS